MSPGNGERLELKLDYDGVLEEWGDKGLPLPEEISPSSSPGVDIQALAANIDLFTVDGDLNQSTATNKSKNVSSDQRPRSKGRFVRKPNSFVSEDVTH
ncbi:hypothetical protein QVD17_22805 [Tagetes erecta]|uniref:Uncharacterized protein n=1 Tax=Tagetes erecta TaxID=13708 RepID=A0AAD8KDD6_TARER|nr:hypothetical protein QVD17_22805 [Tagetes erecta]